MGLVRALGCTNGCTRPKVAQSKGLLLDVGPDELREDGTITGTCKSDQHLFREFRDAVVRARAEAQIRFVGQLAEASKAGNAIAGLASRI